MNLEAEICQRWDGLFSVNHALSGDTGDLFGMGAGEEAIARAERRLGFALPAELKAGSRRHDGVYDAWDGCTFYTLEDIPEQLLYGRNEVAECPPFRCGAGAQPPQFGAQLVPFASGEDETLYCLDYNPGAGGRAGQVSAVCLADASVQVVAGSYVEFLDWGLGKRQAELARARARGRKDANEDGNALSGCLWGIGAIVVGGALALLVVALAALRRVLYPRRLRRWLAGRRERAAQHAPRRAAQPPKVRKPAAPGSITALWYEIEDLNAALGYDVAEQFFAGASEQELDTLERALGRPVPADLRQLFSACAACDEPWSSETRGYAGFVMQDIPQLIEGMRQALSYRPKLRLFPGTRMPEPGPWLIPIETGDSCLCYDLKPGEGGRVGQIVDVDLNRGACRVVAPSLQAWLEQGIACLQREVGAAGGARSWQPDPGARS